jgi:hypothetical protein
LVLYDSSGGTFSILLPVPSGSVDSEIGVKNASDSTNSVTVTATGIAQIDDVASDQIAVARAFRLYKSIGTGYIIM